MDKFRIAETKRTWEEHSHTETYHWLELKPDLWTGTNRPCETREEAMELLEKSGHGAKQTGSLEMLAHTRFLKTTADPGTFKIIGSV